MTSALYFIETITPLHAGSGRGIGLIDLPITRDVVTGDPNLRGSACRGVLRDYFENNPELTTEAEKLFGPKTIHSEADAFDGSLSVNDARLIVMPVRSMNGTQAWVTCARVLNAFRREARLMGVRAGMPDDAPEPSRDSGIICGATTETSLLFGRTVTLEDFTLDAETDVGKFGAAHTQRNEWCDYLCGIFWPSEEDEPWRISFSKRFAIVSDNVFSHFEEYATDVRARVRLDESRVVVKGALWNEENLPAGSLLAGVITAQKTRKVTQPAEVIERLPRAALMQFGGKFSVGRGAARFIVPGEVQHAG